MRMMGATASRRSAFAVASPFGVISPKISTRSVIAPGGVGDALVAEPLERERGRHDAPPMLTMLFPIRIVASSRSGFALSSSQRLRAAPTLLRERARARLAQGEERDLGAGEEAGENDQKCQQEQG
jgi:hypothetical protein